MIILDSKDSSIINDIAYFDDISIKLFSTKIFTIISDSDLLSVNITKGDAFGVFSYNDVTKEMYDEGKTFSSQSTTTIPTGYVHNVAVYCKNELEMVNTDVITFDDMFSTQNVLVQCETIDEEARFAVALSNNKFYINETFIKAFKESEINEHYTDFKILNEKRRELLLDLFSIKSFIGVYSGLISALNYFGYDDDVIIKEFWTYFDNQLQEYVLSRHDIEKDVSRLPKGFTKTNMFNITYKFNDITGEYGDDDLPVLVNTFFNDYEALVKMSNLKLILETYFLPAHAIIVEIIGEHTSFYKSGIGYYMHQAIIHYYETEVKKPYEYEFHEYHQSRQTILHEEPKTAVVFGKYALRLNKVFAFHSDDHVEEDPYKFYDDNFAYVKLKTNEDFSKFMVSMDIVVVDSKNREVLKIADDERTDEILIGFLKDDKYTVKMLCTDKYNLMHVYELKLETKFIDHDFDTFTVKNGLNYIEPVKRTRFTTTKEAFEYFKYFDEVTKFNGEKTKTEYAGLEVIHGYDSFKSTDGIQDYQQYKAGEYPVLNDMIYNLKPYRFITENMAFANGFQIDPEKYARIPKELYNSLNKSYVMVFQELVNGENIVKGDINGNAGEFKFFTGLSGDELSVENGVVRSFNLKREDYYESKTLGIFNDFDCYCYNIMDALTKISKKYVMLLSRRPYDTVLDKFNFTEFQFKNIISHDGAFTYFNVYDNMDIGKNIELRTVDKLYYRRSQVDISDIDTLIAEIKQMFAQYPALSRFQVIKLDNHSVFINGDQTFFIRIGENILCSGGVRDHLVNDLIKTEAGADVMQYSIVFAKINRASKSRPYDITWRLYENSGNDKNLITTSNDFFFHYVLPDKTSYSLELEYYDKPNIFAGDVTDKEQFKKTITKEGVYLTKNNYFDTLYKKFVETQYPFR